MAIFPTIFPRLPEYPGPYVVGSIEVEVPLQELPRRFDGLDTNIETLLVRFFYPADLSNSSANAASSSIFWTKRPLSKPLWCPQPAMEYARGYADFFKQPQTPAALAISLAVYNKHIPAFENAPPITPPHGRLPVMLFSHGLGGSRNAYSQWCGSIASHGVFVAAIEHRDGSAPISIIRAGTPQQVSVPYRRVTEWNEETKRLRESQLALRTYEVAKLVSLLRDINHGVAFDIPEDKAEALGQFRDLLNTKKGQFIMAGHSFGAATTVAACKDIENVEANYPLKEEFRAAVMLDIWMMPLSAIPTSKLTLPTLHIISEQFLNWSDNYRALPPLLEESRTSSSFARLFYVKGSAHLSQSDFNLLFPILCRRYFHAKAEAYTVMEVNVRAGVEFLRTIGVEGINDERDPIFDEELEVWEELEKDMPQMQTQMQTVTV